MWGSVMCARNTLITITSSKYLIRYLHINWVANQVFNTSNSNVLGSLHVNVNVNVSSSVNEGLPSSFLFIVLVLIKG